VNEELRIQALKNRRASLVESYEDSIVELVVALHAAQQRVRELEEENGQLKERVWSNSDVPQENTAE